MRCYSCNVRLSNVEATRKFASGAFTDLCNKCLSTIQEDVLVDDEGLSEFEDEEEPENGSC